MILSPKCLNSFVLALFLLYRCAFADDARGRRTSTRGSKRWTPPCQNMAIDRSDPGKTTGGSRVDVTSLCYRHSSDASSANAEVVTYRALIGEPTEHVSTTSHSTSFCKRFGIPDCGHYPSLSITTASKRRLETDHSASRALQKTQPARSFDGAIIFRQLEVVSFDLRGRAKVQHKVDFNSPDWSPYRVEEESMKSNAGSDAKYVRLQTMLSAATPSGANASFKIMFEISSEAAVKQSGATLAPTFMKITFAANYPGLKRNSLRLIVDTFGQTVFEGGKKSIRTSFNSLSLDELYFSWEKEAETVYDAAVSVTATRKDISYLHLGNSQSRDGSPGYSMFFERMTFLFDAGAGSFIWDPELGLGAPPAATKPPISGSSRLVAFWNVVGFLFTVNRAWLW